MNDRDAFVLKAYNTSNINYHWTEVLPTNKHEVYLCDDIMEKMMFFEAFAAKYISHMPNRYSRAFC